MPIDVDESHIDLLSLSAHKFYGPKGIGALYARRRGRRVKLTPSIWGGGHERGLRSGTLNVPAIVGLGAAADLAREMMATESPRVLNIAARLLDRLRAQVGGIELNGHPAERLPHNLNLYISGVKAKSLIMRLPELAFSTGAACSTAHVEPSHVLEALGLGGDRAFNSVRFGLGRSTAEGDADFAADRLAAAIVAVRRFVGDAQPALR